MNGLGLLLILLVALVMGFVVAVLNWRLEEGWLVLARDTLVLWGGAFVLLVLVLAFVLGVSLVVSEAIS